MTRPLDGNRYQVKRAFIASPGDLNEERKLFPRILERLNDIKAHAMGVHLEPVGWEDILPGMGRPQALINKDVEKCDLFVMLLWKRWGTPPAEGSPASSGTEEEYELARSLHKQHAAPQVFLYFRDVSEEMLSDPGEQLQKVLAFRRKVERERALLYTRYANAGEWENALMKHIAQWLDGFAPGAPPMPGPLPSESLAQIQRLREQISELENSHRDAETKLRRVAIEYGGRASEAAANGQLTEAEELFSRAVSVYPEPSIINAYGAFYLRIGSLPRAEEKFHRAQEIGQALGNNAVLAAVYGNLGVLLGMRGDLKQAEGMHRKALGLDERVGAKEGMAQDYTNLGVVHQIRGDLDQAEEMHLKALAINIELGRKKGVAANYCGLGGVYIARGSLPQAEQAFQKGLALFRELGSEAGVADTYANLAGVYRARGDMALAEENYRNALSLHSKLGNRIGLATDYGNLGVLYQHQSNLDQAERMLRLALAMNAELGRSEGMANNYRNLGSLYWARGNMKEAEDKLLRALALDKTVGSKEGMANDYGNLGLVYQKCGDLTQAEEMHRKALALFETFGGKEGMANAYGNLGEIFKGRGDLAKAEEMFQKSLALFREIGAKPGIDRTLRNLEGIKLPH
jgi:tetratricopeptide (TPR) repeat protein